MTHVEQKAKHHTSHKQQRWQQCAGELTSEPMRKSALWKFLNGTPSSVRVNQGGKAYLSAEESVESAGLEQVDVGLAAPLPGLNASPRGIQDAVIHSNRLKSKSLGRVDLTLKQFLSQALVKAFGDSLAEVRRVNCRRRLCSRPESSRARGCLDTHESNFTLWT